MAKDKEKEIEYKKIGYLRAQVRKENRRYSREQRKHRYGKEVCDMCGGYMSWCTCCEVWSSTCCQDYGTCQCS